MKRAAITVRRVVRREKRGGAEEIHVVLKRGLPGGVFVPVVRRGARLRGEDPLRAVAQRELVSTVPVNYLYYISGSEKGS